MDNKYMIEMAEARGLFGKNNANRSKATAKEKAKKQEKPSSPLESKTRRKGKDIEVIYLINPCFIIK